MELAIIPVALFGASGVTTTLLVLLLIYRALLSSREDDQIFIGAAEQVHSEELRELVARMTRLQKPIIALGVISAALFFSGVGFWLYQGLMSF